MRHPAGGMTSVKSHPLADKAGLSGVRRHIRAELNRLEIDPSVSFDCLVAVTEACTNALLHGLGERGDGLRPRLSWEIDGDSARFCIQDFSNQRWSMAAHPSGVGVDDPLSDLERRIGGFGIEIMRDLMDEVDIRIQRRGTMVSLTKRLT